jgi:hypothetical protein
VGNLSLVRRDILVMYSKQSMLKIIRILNISMAMAHAITCLGMQA